MKLLAATAELLFRVISILLQIIAAPGHLCIVPVLASSRKESPLGVSCAFAAIASKVTTSRAQRSTERRLSVERVMRVSRLEPDQVLQAVGNMDLPRMRVNLFTTYSFLNVQMVDLKIITGVPKSGDESQPRQC
jgi:hypothetical protein